MTTPLFLIFFFFNDTATTEIYTLSLHDALPISTRGRVGCRCLRVQQKSAPSQAAWRRRLISRNKKDLCFHTYEDRKSTRLNSSHSQISYAVFCLKKKKKNSDRLSDHRLL